MELSAKKSRQRTRRHRRVRKKVVGSTERPRLSVFRSLKHIYGQIVDDTTGKTLVSASTRSAELRDKVLGAKKTDAARAVGQHVAEKAKAQGIELVVFDRGGYKYHGRVKALAEGARKGGLGF